MWNQIQQALSGATVRLLSQMAALLPGIVALILALLISALAAWVVGVMLRRSLTGIRFDQKLPQWGFPFLRDWSPHKSPTLLVTRTISSAIVFVGFLIALSVFDVSLTSEMMRRFVEYLPNVLAAVVVLVAGSFIARFLARSVLIGAVNMNLQYARLLSVGVKWLVLVLAVTMALEHLGIGSGIITLAFGILFGGIVLALALAVGLGSKEMVSRSLEREVNRASTQTEEPVSHL